MVDEYEALADANLQIAQFEERIARQRQHIAAVQAQGSDTDLDEMLLAFELDFLAAAERRRDLILIRMEGLQQRQQKRPVSGISRQAGILTLAEIFR